MPKFQYPYIEIPLPATPPYPKGNTVYRPFMVATITASNGNSFRCLVWPDTGADCCLFPLSIAIALKIDVLSLPQHLTGGVGSQSNMTYYDTVTIDLGNGIAFSAYTGFTQGMDAQGWGLLGQQDFFSGFHVEFKHALRHFTIETI